MGAIQSEAGLDRLFESDFMCQRLERALAPLASVPIRVRGVGARAVGSGKLARARRVVIEYELDIESQATGSHAYHIVATVPVAPEACHEAGLLEACAAAQELECLKPFERLAGYIEELRMAFHFVAADPALPALRILSGPQGPALLAPWLSECRAGATLERLDTDVKRYKPGSRCTLRATARFAGGAAAPVPRHVYVKIFADDRGQRSFRELQALWEAACAAPALRVPQPLGYDAAQRMLVMSEVPGRRDVTDWIRCLDDERPLPAGVDLERARRCMDVAARAIHDLHAAVIPLEARCTYREELRQMRKDLGVLPESVGHLRPAFTEALAELEAAATDEGLAVPSHCGFRHKHLVGDEQSLSIIDWDGLAMAHPALDAATFLRALRHEPLGRPGEAVEVERLADFFRARFLEHEPAAAADLPVYEAMAIVQGAIRALRRPGRAEREAAEMANRLAAARALLASP